MAPKTIMPTPRSLPSQTTDVPGEVMSTIPSTQNKTDMTKYPILAVFIGTTERIASSPFRANPARSCFSKGSIPERSVSAMDNKNRVSERQTSGFICLKIGQVSGLLAGRAAVFQNQLRYAPVEFQHARICSPTSCFIPPSIQSMHRPKSWHLMNRCSTSRSSGEMHTSVSPISVLLGHYMRRSF